MANSPAKTKEDDRYRDFDMTFIGEEATTTSRYKYSFHVNNHGDGYIAEIYRDYSSNSYSGVYFLDLEDNLFFNQLIGPHTECDIAFESEQFYAQYASYSAYAYTEFSQDAVISGSFEITLENEPYYVNEDSQYEYFIDAKIKNLNENKYYYRYIFNFTYDNAPYSVIIYNYYYNENRKGFSFTSKQRLDLSKLTVGSNPIVVNQQRYSDYKDPTLDIPALLISLGIVVGGIGVFLVIYLPIKAKKKNEKQS